MISWWRVALLIIRNPCHQIRKEIRKIFSTREHIETHLEMWCHYDIVIGSSYFPTIHLLPHCSTRIAIVVL
jgi:hypothetical protein